MSYVLASIIFLILLAVSYKIYQMISADISVLSSSSRLIEKCLWPSNKCWEYRHCVNWFLIYLIIGALGQYGDSLTGGPSYSKLSIAFKIIVEFPIGILMMVVIYKFFNSYFLRR